LASAGKSSYYHNASASAESGGWQVMGAAAVATSVATMAMISTTFCEAPPKNAEQKESPSPIRRFITKTGIKDPMTSYQQQVERRDDQRVGVLHDPMTSYQKSAMEKSSQEQTAEGTSTQKSHLETQQTAQTQLQKMVAEQQITPEEQEQVLKLLTQHRQQQKKEQFIATSPPGEDSVPTEPQVNIRGFPTEMTPSEARLEEKTRKAKQHSGGIKVFSGNGNMSLAMEITHHLGISLGRATVGRFADGEVNVVIKENVRGKDVYVVQPTCPPVNDNLMELLLMVSTLRRASARRITVVIPYYGYARQDRKMQARVPISAADVARLMEAIGVDRVIAVDLHCGQIQGFFGPRVPVDNLDGGIVGLDYFGSKDLHNPVIVSPDAGGVYRAKKFKEGLENKHEMQNLGLAMIVKQRARAGTVDQMDLVGDVNGCDCIIVDDMIDTAGTLCKAADVLKANGASRVFAFASHGLLSGPGNERIASSKMEEVVVLNTIPSSAQRAANDKLTELSVAPLLAQAIFNIHAKKSISALFK